MSAPSDPVVQATASPSFPSFPVKPYTPDNGAPVGGVLQLVGGLGLAGVVLGLVAHYVSLMIWLILVFPVLIGLGLGFAASFLVKKGHVRNAALAGVAGFVGGVLSMGSMHYNDYRAIRADFAKNPELHAALREMTEQDVREAVEPKDVNDMLLAQRYARADNVFQFLDARAHEGISIKKAASSDSGKGLNLGYVGTYIYWIVEVCIVAGLAFAGARRQAKQPYSTRLQNWKRVETLGFLSGTDRLALVNAVQSGNVNALVAGGAGANDGSFVMKMAISDNPAVVDDVDVKLEHVTMKDGKPNFTELAFNTWPPSAADALRQAFAPRPPAPPAPQPEIVADDEPST